MYNMSSKIKRNKKERNKSFGKAGKRERKKGEG